MPTRREFLITTGRLSTAAMLGLLTACPTRADTPGAVVVDEPASEIRARIRSERRPLFLERDRLYLISYEVTPRPERYRDAVVGGMMALSAVCPHSPCTVQLCEPSRWFECPCHGCKFNRAGEHMLGPPRRGLDRLRFDIAGDQIVIYTRDVIPGPPRGTDTTGDQPSGPFCI